MSNEFKLVPVEPTKEMRNAYRKLGVSSWADRYAAMLAAAPQPTALGMEPEVVGYGFRNTMVGRRPVMMELRPDIPANDQYGGQLWYPLITQDDHHARVAPLRAEIEWLKDRYNRDVHGLNNEGDPIGGDPAGGYINDLRSARSELDQLKALLVLANAALEGRIDAALSKPAGSEQV